MRLLLTGASGFLGRAVSARAIAGGWEVTGTSRREDLSAAEWPWLPDRADAVAHLAPTGGAATVARLAGWARACGARSFVLASSGSAREPFDAYGRGKREAEEAALAAGLPKAAALRFHTLFGPGQRAGRLVPRLAAAVHGGLAVEVADPDGVRLTPTHVEDAAEAVVRWLAHPFTGIADVAGPEVLTVGEMARRIARTLGRPAALKPRPPLPGERDLAGDPWRLAAFLGWRPVRAFDGAGV